MKENLLRTNRLRLIELRSPLSMTVCRMAAIIAAAIFLQAFLILGVPAQSSENGRGTDEFGAVYRQKGRIKERNGKETQLPVAADPDAITVETNLVLNVVTVLDKDGVVVKGLSKDDFIVTEDGGQQQLELVHPGDSTVVPRSIVLLIDYSGSQLPYIENSIEAAKILVDQINPNDRMAIVTDNIELLQNFTGDKDLLKEKLENLKRSALKGKFGLSRQYSALMSVMQELFTASDSRPIVIFQTDGDELFDLKQTKKGEFKMSGKSGFSFSDIERLTQTTRSTIYAITPGQRIGNLTTEEKERHAQNFLIQGEEAYAKALNTKINSRRLLIIDASVKAFARYFEEQQMAVETLAKSTGGWTEYVEDPASARIAYDRIMRSINSGYVLGYYPSDESRGPRTRKISVIVRGHPEYKVVGRDSYILDPRSK
ncbi:MAG: VWA domain-containing protein [Acidobacteriota bacterium]